MNNRKCEIGQAPPSDSISEAVGRSQLPGQANRNLILYHRTNAASQILAVGFRDGVGTFLTDRKWRGVWLSDRPLDENEGAAGDVVLFVEIPDEVVAPFEWVQDIGYREFLVPAEVLNRHPIRRCSICETCGSECGGESCWWCALRGGR